MDLISQNAALMLLTLELLTTLLSRDHLILMDATNTLPATHVSMLPHQLVFNADGALVVPSTTKTMEILHSNVVVTKQINHTLLLAQLNSEHLTAVDSTATLLLISAVNPNKDNSQPWINAIRPVLSLLNTRSATTLLRNARHVIIPRTQIAKIPVLTVKLLAINHMLNAMKLLVHVHHVIQLRIRIAQILKVLVEQNARKTQNLSVIIALENATHAQMDKDVFQVLAVIKLARKYHQMKPMPATGPNPHQPVSKIQRVPLTRNHVLTNAKLHHLESVTSRQVCALIANKVIQNAPQLWMSVKLLTRRNTSARLKLLMAYTE